jgi:hypothetical protein
MAAGQNYGIKTSNLMDMPLAVKSVFAPYVGDQNYSAVGVGSIRVNSTPNGVLSDYTETSKSPVTVNLATTDNQTLDLNYNKAMFSRIQKTLMQDNPVANFAAKWAKQQLEQVFVPNHDTYSLGKVKAARPVDNVVTFDDTDLTADTAHLSLNIGKALTLTRRNGANANNSLLWITDTYSANLQAKINFTGSDAGYKEAKNTSFLGRHRGVMVIEVPDSYLDSGVYGILADKAALVNIVPKMSPENYTVITKMSGFSGVEVQMRDRGDTFVLDKKVGVIATIEGATSSASTA